jgi:hypothetical protein
MLRVYSYARGGNSFEKSDRRYTRGHSKLFGLVGVKMNISKI